VVMRLLLALLSSRHPIHSSSAMITLDAGSGSASIVLRAFAGDFPPGQRQPAIESYLAERFRIIDRAGIAVPLRVVSVRKEGLVVVTVLTTAAPRGLSGYLIWHGVLSERFADQVNIVQARYGGRSVSLLFTASDSAKQLP